MAKSNRMLRFDDSLEPIARDLYQAACRNGEAVLRSKASITEALSEENVKASFFRDAHIGFDRAQDQILEILVANENKSIKADGHFLREELLLRKLADSIAWQMIGSQLYLARRLYSGQKPSRLTTSNYLSVHRTAKHLISGDYAKMALMADLTTFVQLGDLLVIDSNTGEMSFFEVKEGRKNHEYMESLKFLSKSQCPEYLNAFYQKEGKNGIDQLSRMAKQMARMGQVSKILNTGEGFDPLLNANVHIPEEEFFPVGWDSQLRSVIERSIVPGWAIDVVDGVLFLGAYRGVMNKAAPLIFKSWFDGATQGRQFPIINLMQCMEIPLALPLFSHQLPTEAIFDLLFGRCRVYLAINWDGIASLVEKRGGTARWASRKESARFRRTGNPIASDDRFLVCGKGGANIYVSDGLVLRLAFHNTSPVSIADYIIRMLDDRLGRSGAVEAV